MNDVLNVAVYKRVNPDSINQISSYELQNAYYKSYVASHPGWRFAGYYCDEGTKSAGFQRLLQDCEAGKVNFIVTKSVSRFAGSIADCLRVIQQLKKLTPPVGVCFECEGINSLDETAEDQLLQWMQILS